MFECVVCGGATRAKAHLYGSARGPVALCGFRCCRRFLSDPYEFIPAEVELGVGD